MIVLISGSRGVGKSTVIKELKLMYPRCVIKEGFRNLHNGLDCNKYDEFIENERQYINREIQWYKHYLKENTLVILTRGLEEVLTYMDFFLDNYHPDWNKESIYNELGDDYKLLSICRSDVGIYLDASDNVIMTRLNNDLEKNRNNIDMWLSFNRYTRKIFRLRNNFYFVNSENLSVKETARAVNAIINNAKVNIKNNTEIFSLDKTIIKKTSNFSKAERFLHSFNYQKHIALENPSRIPLPINLFIDDSKICLEETKIDGAPWDPSTKGSEVVVEEMALFFNQFYKAIDKTIQWRQKLMEELKKYLDIMKQTDLLSNEILKSIYNDFLQNQAIIPEHCSNIIHGDLNSSNILVCEDNGSLHFSGLVDFEWCQIGDPIYDIAKLNFVFMRYNNLKFVFYNSLEIMIPKKLFDLYFTLILLKQLSMYKELQNKPIWKKYLTENIMLIKEKYSSRIKI